jgi:hypothetical protein
MTFIFSLPSAVKNAASGTSDRGSTPDHDHYLNRFFSIIPEFREQPAAAVKKGFLSLSMSPFVASLNFPIEKRKILERVGQNSSEKEGEP